VCPAPYRPGPGRSGETCRYDPRIVGSLREKLDKSAQKMSFRSLVNEKISKTNLGYFPPFSSALRIVVRTLGDTSIYPHPYRTTHSPLGGLGEGGGEGRGVIWKR
jgi:hypothetical protein